MKSYYMNYSVNNNNMKQIKMNKNNMEQTKGYIYIRKHPAYDIYNACKLGKASNIPVFLLIKIINML